METKIYKNCNFPTNQLETVNHISSILDGELIIDNELVCKVNIADNLDKVDLYIIDLFITDAYFNGFDLFMNNNKQGIKTCLFLSKDNSYSLSHINKLSRNIKEHKNRLSSNININLYYLKDIVYRDVLKYFIDDITKIFKVDVDKQNITEIDDRVLINHKNNFILKNDYRDGLINIPIHDYLDFLKETNEEDYYSTLCNVYERLKVEWNSLPDLTLYTIIELYRRDTSKEYINILINNNIIKILKVNNNAIRYEEYNNNIQTTENIIDMKLEDFFKIYNKDDLVEVVDSSIVNSRFL